MFSLDKEQLEQLAAWQKKFPFVPLGAIGGSYTYSFTPTTLGVIAKVKNNANGQEIDLTNYLDW